VIRLLQLIEFGFSIMHAREKMKQKLKSSFLETEKMQKCLSLPWNRIWLLLKVYIKMQKNRLLKILFIANYTKSSSQPLLFVCFKFVLRQRKSQKTRLISIFPKKSPMTKQREKFCSNWFQRLPFQLTIDRFASPQTNVGKTKQRMNNKNKQT